MSSSVQLPTRRARARVLQLLLALLLLNLGVPPVARAASFSFFSRKPDGPAIFKQQCAKCHASGTGGAPKIGDKGAWAKHIGGGLDHLKQLAIKGNGAMPARGGNPDLSDIEVTRAIVYMANQSGASFKEPAAAPADAKGAAKK